MDYLWTPWRYQYVQKAKKEAGCIFCRMAAEQDDEANFIVFRGSRNFIVLNIFPYTTGHMMIVPYEHVDNLERASQETLQEMLVLAQRSEGHLREVYRPAGFNLGMNLGELAGAGIADHIHMHVLPRWVADANFVSVVGETRVLPETLDVTWGKISAALR